MRYLYNNIIQDLKKKMVFIGGPRQAGKTTISKLILKQEYSNNGLYLNWDNDEQRLDIIKKKWHDQHSLVIFDEIHKYKRWKNWIKGVYDVEREKHNFLVTGSAKLDIYKKSGDSLLGRYHYWRLHPFTLSEVPIKLKPQETLRRLMTVGGFPEPFLDNSESQARRWRLDRNELIIKNDLRDLQEVSNIQGVQLLLELLKTRVGGLIVISNLARDLQVHPETVTKWINILEQLYLIFTVRSHTVKVTRSIQKPFKVYFYDNADVKGDEGQIFENLVATHLLKKIHFLQDRDGYKFDLKFIRDKEKREIDFAIIKDGLVYQLIEVKVSDQEISKSLIYFSERLNPNKAVQVVLKAKNSFSKNKLFIIDPVEALSSLEFTD